jgi:hypothetical protein
MKVRATANTKAIEPTQDTSATLHVDEKKPSESELFSDVGFGTATFLSEPTTLAIHAAYVDTLVYIPGMLGRAQPAPNDTTPTSSAIGVLFPCVAMYRRGPPLSALPRIPTTHIRSSK